LNVWFVGLRRQKEKEILNLQASLQSQEKQAKMLKAELMQTKATVADARQAAAAAQLQLQKMEVDLAAAQRKCKEQEAEISSLRQLAAERDAVDDELSSALEHLSDTLSQFPDIEDQQSNQQAASPEGH
jgi:predicted RNase H-like nuclease (RuvC/YqgF family)